MWIHLERYAKMMEVSYEYTKDNAITAMSELAVKRLRSFGTISVLVCLACIGSVFLSVFRGPKGSLNGETTPMIDAILTWCVQFPIVTVVLTLILFFIFRTFHVSSVKGLLSKKSDNHWGVNSLSISEDKVSISSPTHDLTMDKSYVSSIIQTLSLIHI